MQKYRKQEKKFVEITVTLRKGHDLSVQHLIIIEKTFFPNPTPSCHNQKTQNVTYISKKYKLTLVAKFTYKKIFQDNWQILTGKPQTVPNLHLFKQTI
jgi:hypothetical protein